MFRIWARNNKLHVTQMDRPPRPKPSAFVKAIMYCTKQFSALITTSLTEFDGSHKGFEQACIVKT